MSEQFFITTPIYYVNDSPHVGHAYSTIAADVLARFHKNQGKDVFFLTGTDEHGMKIARSAAAVGISPKEFADQISAKYIAAWHSLNINYSNFIRTTDPDHEKFVQDFVQKLYDQGDIYPDKYKGLYCVGCEEYKKAEDLIDGKICPIHKHECEMLEEDIYFFKLSKYQNQILEAIQSGKYAIEPESRRNEIFKFLAKEPLRDLAISRSKVEWGIPVPFDKTQTIYVWVDALLNYLTGSKGIWPPTIQIIAKDIFRFHAIIWPAMLIALGYELPKKLFIHGYFTVNGQKMSKSLGNVVNPVEIAKVYGADALRYFVLREVPFGGDGDFSLARFEDRYRADLANDLGNLLQRTIVMAKNSQIHWEYKEPAKSYKDIDTAIVELRFSDALNLIWKIISDANREIDAQKPWELVKTDPVKNEKVLQELLDTLVDVASLIDPFMPETAIKMKNQLKTGQAEPLFPRKK